MKMATMTVVTFMVVALCLTTRGRGQSNTTQDCSSKFLRTCNDANSTQGLEACCTTIGGFMVTDQPCLCYIFQLVNLTEADALRFLGNCGVDTNGTTLRCEGYSGSSSSPSMSPPPPPLQNHDPATSTPIEDSSTSSSNSTSMPALVGAVVGSIVVLCLVVVLALLFLRKRRTPSTSVEASDQQNHAKLPGGAIGSSLVIFTYEELFKATNGFSDDKLLGQGGFGSVHKGVLPNGSEIAVKKQNANGKQGEREFQTEVEIISRVHHKHIVSLIGYCITNDMLLVYEYIPNKTLQFHLHENSQKCLDWTKRMKIAIGSAKGLTYLHEDCNPKIIHRDIKSPNILLDYNFEPKVADFGLAKSFPDGNSQLLTRVVGTFGYLAPEYIATNQATEKSDVFSFGIMLLELITGRKPTDKPIPLMECSLLNWAIPLLAQALKDGKYDTFVDPCMQNNFNSDEMACMVACALACIHHNAQLRPWMKQVVRILEGEMLIEVLNQGMRPRQSLPYG